MNDLEEFRAWAHNSPSGELVQLYKRHGENLLSGIHTLGCFYWMVDI